VRPPPVRDHDCAVGADVEVTIEIAAKRDEGFADDVTRTVGENARTLKFDQYGFEES
jgi:hypothetical protein